MMNYPVYLVGPINEPADSPVFIPEAVLLVLQPTVIWMHGIYFISFFKMYLLPPRKGSPHQASLVMARCDAER